MKRLICLLLAFSFTHIVHSQSNLGETIKAQLIKDWKLTKALTNEYLNTMPMDKYSFKANDSTRNFAQQMLHIAQVTAAMISHGTGEPRLFARGLNLEQSSAAQTKDSVQYYVNASYDYAINAIQKFDMSKLDEKVKVREMEETRLGWLLKAFDHQTHHRGQTAVYIRLVGQRPPTWVE